MEPLLQDRQAACRLGADGREGMAKRFRIEHTADRMMQVCAQIAQQSQ